MFLNTRRQLRRIQLRKGEARHRLLFGIVFSGGNPSESPTSNIFAWVLADAPSPTIIVPRDTNGNVLNREFSGSVNHRNPGPRSPPWLLWLRETTPNLRNQPSDLLGERRAALLNTVARKACPSRVGAGWFSPDSSTVVIARLSRWDSAEDGGLRNAHRMGGGLVTLVERRHVAPDASLRRGVPDSQNRSPVLVPSRQRRQRRFPQLRLRLPARRVAVEPIRSGLTARGGIRPCTGYVEFAPGAGKGVQV